MRTTLTRTKLYAAVAVVVATLSLAGCGEDTPANEETRTAANGEEFNDADVTFATDMIQHHAQALEMVDMTVDRDVSPEVAALAEDIRAAQGPEIEQFVDWLNGWDEPVPETSRDHANAHGDGQMEMGDMPGMMSEEEMSALEAAQGEEFETMWLEMMVKHHTGAIEMAQAEQEDGRFPAAVETAETIESSQQAEIDTMEDLLAS